MSKGNKDHFLPNEGPFFSIEGGKLSVKSTVTLKGLLYTDKNNLEDIMVTSSGLPENEQGGSRLTLNRSREMQVQAFSTLLLQFSFFSL